MSSAAQTPPSKSTIDPYKYLRIIPNADGTSLTRLPEIPNIFPRPSPPIPVLTKDITINQSNKTWARLYVPEQAHNSPTENTKLPVLVWFHGGGFILFSAASTFFHDYCARLSVDLNVLVVSIEYRLAPEHRLPAAYDDAVEALQWIKTSPDEWFRQYGDLGKCFLKGGSAGGNIAYHAGLRVAKRADDFEPLKIKGMILHQPFFGGSKRSESELKLIHDRILPLCCNDLMWELCLPIGAYRDHEYSNPTAVDEGCLYKMKELKWRIMVDWGDKDPLMDRQIELIKIFKDKGLQVVSYHVEGGCHGVEFLDPLKAKDLNAAYKTFISSACVLPSDL